MYYSKDALAEFLSFGLQALLSSPPLTSPTSIIIHQPQRRVVPPFCHSRLLPPLLVHDHRHNPVRVSRTTNHDDDINLIILIVIDQRAVH
jgi:hypothetical protein